MNRSDSEARPSALSRYKFVLLLGGVAGLLFLGGWLERAGLLPEGSDAPPEGDWNKRSALLREDLTVFEFELSPEALSSLATRHAAAVKKPWFEPEETGFVAARLRLEDRELDAKMRLSANGQSSQLNAKWPLVVQLDDPLYERGPMELVLDAPELHGFGDELFQAESLHTEGFLTRRPELVSVRINGEDRGLYLAAPAVPELGSSGGRESNGPLVRFVSDQEWGESEEVGAPRQALLVDEFLTAPVEVVETNSLRGAQPDRDVLRRATALLDGFRRGQLTTSQAFDRDKLAHFFALTDLLGTSASASWRELCFQYDPVLARLEPTGFRVSPRGLLARGTLAASLGRPASPESERIDEVDRPWFARLFADEEFTLAYIADLSACVEGEFFDRFVERAEAKLADPLAVLQIEYPEARSPAKRVEANRKALRALLDPKQTVRAHLIYVDQLQASLAVSNLLDLPVEVLELDLGKDSTAPVIGGPVRLERRERGKALEFTTISFDAPEVDWTEERIEKLEIRTRVLGSPKRNKDMVIPKAPTSFSSMLLRSPQPNFKQYSFLRVDEQAQTVSFDSGLCALGEDLVLPSGWTLVAGPGTTIDLQHRSAIITHSPVRFVGSAEQPIRITSTDASGQGLCVLDAAGESELRWVQFEKLRSIDRQGWQMNGAVTFYRSKFRAEHSSFREIWSEDALNAVETEFLLNECLFEDVDSDAFDADYCEGKLTSCTVNRAKDDAIDLSGSSIAIHWLRVDGTGDKGISAGEDSIVVGDALWFTNCELAVASKNRSRCTLEDVHVESCTVGFAVYQNNDDSGPASLRVKGLEISKTKTRFDIEPDSELVLDGQVIQDRE